mgnify:CR=1 FL=1
MLTCKLTGDILEVKETLHWASQTKVTHWYYNIRTWHHSSYGKPGDTPDRPMTQEAIAWVEKYYLPKVKG